MSKYRNRRTKVGDITFDSAKEAQRWGALKLMQDAGLIANLRRQVRFDLHALGGAKVATYVADSVYDEKGDTVVEDVKSVITRKLPVYKLKKKWMLAEHGIVIREV